MVVAGEAGGGGEALKMALNEEYDLVLLDIAMPDKGGLEVLKELRSEKPNLPILMLSMYPEEQYAIRSLKAGSSGYLTRESAPAELVAAIQKVSPGGKYISSSLAENLAFYLDTVSEKPCHE